MVLVPQRKATRGRIPLTSRCSGELICITGRPKLSAGHYPGSHYPSPARSPEHAYAGSLRHPPSEPPGRASERFRYVQRSGSGHPGAPHMPSFARRRPALKPSPTASDQAMASFLFGIQEPFLFPHEEREMGLVSHFFPRSHSQKTSLCFYCFSYERR